MRIARYALSVAIGALLAGCGGSQPSITSFSASPQTASSSTDRYTMLLSFGANGNAERSKAAIVANVHVVLARASKGRSVLSALASARDANCRTYRAIDVSYRSNRVAECRVLPKRDLPV